LAVIWDCKKIIYVKPHVSWGPFAYFSICTEASPWYEGIISLI
jgi:hypothetical protein